MLATEVIFVCLLMLLLLLLLLLLLMQPYFVQFNGSGFVFPLPTLFMTLERTMRKEARAEKGQDQDFSFSRTGKENPTMR